MPKRQIHRHFTPKAVSKTQPQPLEVRRSANYRPSLWEHEYLLSLGNTYAVRTKIYTTKLLYDYYILDHADEDNSERVKLLKQENFCFLEAAANLGRVAHQCVYQHGDGHGCPDKAKTVHDVRSLLVHPVPLD
ncbi:hypothetical protein EUTSA_v10027310mg [Eutrema salsugineum]|uniref:Terpene synthase N-terminal domain-containing protein n=1 Tax=Eutrema salsugineum TaxID=72664 RepID=V4MRE7_EUTSA|nr:hypothetical protein EUTSA_v10027310mg [Eutrema salsugineum]